MSNRRPSSDEARSWVRSIHFGNPYAKAVMMAVAAYCNDQGCAYPGIGTLHQDTEIAENTIVARLKWCEAIGAITLSKCWVDENGNRNKAGRGRPTSTEVRFLFDADIAAIEAAAREHSAEKPLRGFAKKTNPESPVSPSSHAEQNEEPDSAVSPSLAPQQPLTPCGRILKEEEESPQTPLRGAFEEKKVEAKEDSELERDWTEFRSSGYPDGIIDVDAARRELRKLPHETRRKAIDGVPAYADYCRRRRQKSKAAHLYLRKRVWEGLSAAPAAQSSPTNHPPNSPAGRALANLARIARYNLWRLSDGSIPYQGPITPQILAFQHAPEETVPYPHGSPNFAAYRRLLDEVFAGRPLPALMEIAAPWPFPPRVDGTISSSPAPSPTTGPPRPTLTDDDQDYIAQNGL